QVVGGAFPLPVGCIKRNNEYWISDKSNGLVKGVNSWSNSSVYSNSPFTDGSYRIDIQYGTVLVAGGGLTHNLQSNYFRNGVYRFQDETWTNFNYTNQSLINNDENWDFISVAVNPS